MPVWNYDPSQYKESNFSLIPVGDYRVRIADVVEKKFASGNEGYEFTLDVNGYAAKMWNYLVLDASDPARTNQRIGEFFDCFGITSPAMGNGKQWVGLVGAARIKHEDYKGEKRAKIAYWIARSRQEKLDAWKNVTGSAPVAAPVSQVEIPAELPFDM